MEQLKALLTSLKETEESLMKAMSPPERHKYGPTELARNQGRLEMCQQIMLRVQTMIFPSLGDKPAPKHSPDCECADCIAYWEK